MGGLGARVRGGEGWRGLGKSLYGTHTYMRAHTGHSQTEGGWRGGKKVV